MKLERTGWLAVMILAMIAAGVVAAIRWPDASPSLPCAPEQVRWIDAGTAMVARCSDGETGEGAPVPAGAALTLGGKLDLNQATEAELGLVPGVGPTLAHELVEARTRVGGFTSWEQVDQVRGVGQTRLEALQKSTRLAGSTNNDLP